MRKCERCGAPIPDTLALCPDCLRLAGADAAEVSASETMRDIAAILSIEAGTEASEKQAVQAIMNIAVRLERSVTNGKTE